MSSDNASRDDRPDQAQTDGADEATAVLEDLESLRARSQERDQFLDLLRRTQADFENYQKRNQREREQERRYMLFAFAQDLLPVIDNLERAAAAAQQAGETGPLVQGVHMVLDQFLNLLKRHGIVRIDAAGQPFDPNVHQAVMKQPASTEFPPNTIAKELEHGYLYHDRVLRPSRVIVAVEGLFCR
jgi:molecular chaperone GrpE